MQIVQAEQVIETPVFLADQPDFLADLPQEGDAPRRFGWKGDHARPAGGTEHGAEAAVDVAAGETLEAFHAGQGDQLVGARPVTHLHRHAMGVQFPRVSSVDGDAVTGEPIHQPAPVRYDDIGAEQPGGPVQFPAMDIEQRLEVRRRFPAQLQPSGQFPVPPERFVRTAVFVVHPVAPPLDQHRNPGGEYRRSERPGYRAFEIDAVEPSVAQASETLRLLGRPGRFQLDDTGRRVPPEERTLWTAKHLDPVQVERGITLQQRIFKYDAVVDHGNGLRGVQVEVRVAQAPYVEAGKNPAVGGLHMQAGHPVRQESKVHAR